MGTKLLESCALAAAVLMGCATTAQAAFEGRDASGASSSTCTATGASKCTYFYDTDLDITILNNWNLGKGTWSSSGAPGSAQALAESAGFSASGLTGWVLPTASAFISPGDLNQFGSIWSSVGSSFAGLMAQFDGLADLQSITVINMWSSTPFPGNPTLAFGFRITAGLYPGMPFSSPNYAVAVRPGDIASVSSVPEPGSIVMMLAGMGVLGMAALRRAR